MMVRNLKIAFVQDALPFQAGAEKVLAAALRVFPQAPIYTLIYNQEAFRGTIFENHPIFPSFINLLPDSHRNYRLYLPLMPMALDQFDLRDFEIVISFSYAVAHAAPTNPEQLHISYIHTPLRYAWNGQLFPQVFPDFRNLPASALKPLLWLFRLWDRSMSGRTDHFLTNSRWMAGRIWHVYQRRAEVLYPPVDTDQFSPCFPREKYFVAVSRLVGYKRLDLVVEAFSRLKYPLIVVGEGPQLAGLRARSSSNIHFLGWQPAERLEAILGKAKAFVHAGEEDFGIAMAEAQAAGCPVIALNRGGAPEIVFDGRTGVLFDEQHVDSLCGAIERFESQGVQCGAEEIQASAQRFNRQRFQDELERSVQEKWAARTSKALPYLPNSCADRESTGNFSEH
jgi:glycosyltransferase involved in cell wall biosynthesis